MYPIAKNLKYYEGVRMKIVQMLLGVFIIPSSYYAMEMSKKENPSITIMKVKDKWIKIYPTVWDQYRKEKAQIILNTICPNDVTPNEIHDAEYQRTFFDHYLQVPLPKEFYATLLKNGADPFIKDASKHRWPTFFSAITLPNFPALEALMNHENGILLPNLKESTDCHGNTALHRLLLFGEKTHNAHATAKFLLLHGFDPNSSNIQGETPLHLACRWGNHYKLAELFLKYGADPNEQTTSGNTPFHECFCSDYSGIPEEKIAIARLLLRYKADLEIQNNFRTTAKESVLGHCRVNISEIIDYEDYNSDAGELLVKHNAFMHTNSN